MKKTIKRAVASFLLILPLVSGVQSNAKAAENEDLVEYAKTLQGTPYKWGGLTPSGFDCSGFTTYVFDHFGVQLPRTAADQYAKGEVVSGDELLPGDLVYFTTYKKGASHAGIYIGDRKFIHASDDGVQITSLDKSYYKQRYLGARRYIEVSQVKDATTLLPVKEGQIGMVTIKKKINLWQRDENNKLTAVRVLNPGEKYRVYGQDDLYGGQFNLGSGLYITNIEDHLDYISVTPAK